MRFRENHKAQCRNVLGFFLCNHFKTLYYVLLINYLCTMGDYLTEQELHNLAMNIVGEDLKSQGFEFMAVNSKLKRDPQFVALKDKKLHFVVVRARAFPDNANVYDKTKMEEMRDHALKFEARTFYAGVGLGHGDNYQMPVERDQPYREIYNGLQEIL